MNVETRSKDCLTVAQGQQTIKICSYPMGRIEDIRSTLLEAIKLVLEYKALRVNRPEKEMSYIFKKVRDGSIFSEYLKDLKIDKINSLKSEAYSKKIELTKQLTGKEYSMPTEFIKESLYWKV